MNSMDGRIYILQAIPKHQELAQDRYDKFVTITH